MRLTQTVHLQPFETKIVPTNVIFDELTTHVALFRSSEALLDHDFKEVFIQGNLSGTLHIKLVNNTPSEQSYAESVIGELILYNVAGKECVF